MHSPPKPSGQSLIVRSMSSGEWKVASLHRLPNNAPGRVVTLALQTRKRLVSLCFGATLSSLCATALGEPVTSTGKGIAGGALLGAEVLVFTEAAVGFESPWLFAAGAGVGAVGGGVGGYFIEKGGNAELSLYMLVSGMALLIPVSITYLDAVAYSPESAEPPSPPTTLEQQFELGAELRFPAAVALRTDSQEPSLLVVEADQLRIGVPNVAIENAYSRAEMLEFALPRAPAVMVPMLAGRF